MKYTLLLLTFLLSSIFVQSQGPAYTTTGAYVVVNNLASCASTNCFKLLNTDNTGQTVPEVAELSTGYDGYVVGVDVDGYAWTLPPISSSQGTKSLWTPGPGYMNTLKLGPLAVRSATEIYAVDASNSCSSGYYRFAYWNGKRWAEYGITNCISEVSVTPDDVVYAIGEQGVITYTKNPTGNPADFVTATFAGTGWQNVVGIDSTTAFAVKNQTLYAINLSAGTATVFSGAPAVVSLTATGDGYIFVNSSVSKPSLSYYNLKAANPSWIHIVGGMTAIRGGISTEVFGLVNGAPYHLMALALGVKSTISGSYDCNGSCPPGSYHTGSTGSSFGPSRASNSALPQNNLQATALNFSSECDPMFGDPSDPSCNAEVDGEVICPVMGNIFSQSFGLGLPQLEPAYTFTIWTGEYTSCTTDKYQVTRCNFIVDDWCTPATTPPDFEMNGEAIWDLKAPAYGFWGVRGICGRWHDADPWSCAYGGALGFTGQWPQQACTSNP